MRRGFSAPRAIGAALAACVFFGAASSSVASLFTTIAIASRLELLDGRLSDLDASLRAESAVVSERIEEFAKTLGRDIAEEGASGRAGLSRRAALVEARLSRALEGRDALLSEISLKIDRLGREPELSRIDAVVKDGRSEGMLMRDISLARALEEAERCFAAGRYADAAARYAVVAEALPGDPRLRQRRAVSMFRANPADSSNYGFIEGELRNPAAGESAEALDVLASIAIERQEWAKALDYLDTLIGIEPRNAKVLKEAGDCASYAGEVGRALAYFERACAADPSDHEAAGSREKARASVSPEKSR
jgi:tetratricopeptide (TPR) repeat protein